MARILPNTANTSQLSPVPLTPAEAFNPLKKLVLGSVCKESAYEPMFFWQPKPHGGLTGGGA